MRQLLILRRAQRAGGEVPAAGAGLTLGPAPVVDALPPLVVAGVERSKKVKSLLLLCHLSQRVLNAHNIILYCF